MSRYGSTVFLGLIFGILESSRVRVGDPVIVVT